MKNIIIVSLLIGLVVIVGCTFTSTEIATEQDNFQTQDIESEQDDSTDSCVQTLKFKDGESQNIVLNNKNYEIKAHIESEDNWASFTVNGNLGPKGLIHDDKWGNGLMLPGNEHGISNKIIITEVTITLLDVGYDEYNQEFAEICVG